MIEQMKELVEMHQKEIARLSLVKNKESAVEAINVNAATADSLSGQKSIGAL